MGAGLPRQAQLNRPPTQPTTTPHSPTPRPQVCLPRQARLHGRPGRCLAAAGACRGCGLRQRRERGAPHARRSSRAA
eukprot:354127-Chlamydomonas_euryale.AAC.1